MANDPARERLDRAADYSKDFAADFAAADLTAQVGYPNHAAQLVIFFNANTAVENAVYTDHKGMAHTQPVPAGGYRISRQPVSALSASSGANVSAVVHWWATIDHTIVPA